MNEVLQKVRQEKVMLDDKIQKLEKFLESEESTHIAPRQLGLLRSQLNFMNSYYQILVLRIDDLEKEDLSNEKQDNKENS